MPSASRLGPIDFLVLSALISTFLIDLGSKSTHTQSQCTRRDRERGERNLLSVSLLDKKGVRNYWNDLEWIVDKCGVIIYVCQKNSL